VVSQEASTPTPARTQSEPHGHHNGWHSRDDWWCNLCSHGTSNWLAGSAVILAFIINAIITLFTAMAYAELGSAMPEAEEDICG
jgi:hypothetical protein